jgi:hypothetical protein
VYYAQVWALAHYLAEGRDERYRDALRRALLDASRGRLAGRADGASGGRLGAGVLVAYFDADVAAFEQGYVEFVRAIVATGGRDRIVRGRSPLDR